MATTSEKSDFAETLTESEIKTLTELINKLFDLTGVVYESKVEFDNDSKSLQIKIDSKDNIGLLIGGHGRTIDSIQRVLAAMIRGVLNKAVRVNLNIGDWREKEHEKIEVLAKRTAERAISSKTEQYLYNLNASERRVVHTILADFEGVSTESSGEGPDRFLIVKPN